MYIAFHILLLDKKHNYFHGDVSECFSFRDSVDLFGDSMNFFQSISTPFDVGLLFFV